MSYSRGDVLRIVSHDEDIIGSKWVAEGDEVKGEVVVRAISPTALVYAHKMGAVGGTFVMRAARLAKLPRDQVAPTPGYERAAQSIAERAIRALRKTEKPVRRRA